MINLISSFVFLGQTQFIAAVKLSFKIDFGII